MFCVWKGSTRENRALPETFLDCNAKKKNDKSYWYKKGKKKETGTENNVLARNMIIRKNYKLDVSICDFYPLGRSIKKSNASFR